MQFPTYSPQYAFGPSVAPMPMYKGGGDVQQTYGLRNAAEQLRERGRGDDTILAHINPQEAGILKLLGGSGTINPHTGLPEFGMFSFLSDIPIVGDVYDAVSSVGKELERGVESIARNKYLGPIAQMASYLHPVSAALYAGLAPEGSSFDVKGAAKAAAMQQIGQGIKEYMAGAPQGGYGPDFNPDPYGPGGIDPTNVYSDPTSFASQQAFDAGIDVASAPPVGALENAIAYSPDPNSYLSGAPSMGEFASAPINAPVVDGYPSAPSVPSAPTTPSYGPYPDVAEIPTDFNYDLASSDISGASADPNILQQGYDAVKQGYNAAAEGIKNLVPEPIRDAYSTVSDYVKDVIPENYRDALSTAKDVVLIGSGATTAYGAYRTKKELDAAKEEADRILRDQKNRKQEEIDWARGVMRDYAPNYERLTAEEVARERGMASGGIASFDDERGSDDELMQGGIASLAKGGLPPRYLQGAGDGMSDSIHARIGGKQEARLADGEFVIPADVVSHLGNGSSNAGAKKLYTMMDRVRNARTGKKRQAPQVKTDRYMPA